MSTDTITHLEAQSALLEEWVETRRQIAMLEARSADLLAQRARLMDADVVAQPVHRDAIERSMIAEFSAAGRIATGSVSQAFADARFLDQDFPALRDTFRAGRVTAAHVREIVRAAAPVRAAIRDGVIEESMLVAFETAALAFAETEAPARTRAHVREVAAAIAGLSLTERNKAAGAERTVTVRSVGDGLALLQAVLPEHLAIGILDRLTRLARVQKHNTDDRAPMLPVDDDAWEAEAAEVWDGGVIFGSGGTFTSDPFEEDLDAYWEHVDRMLAAGPKVIQIPSDERTTDQIRADLLTDLLLGADPSEVQGPGLSNVTATIQVTVNATTLAGLDDHPAQLDGHGELHPDIARALAGRNTGWTRLFLDPTGMVTETDTYTPTAGMRRFLQARDQHCRFPGCRMPVHRCEADHTLDHALGGSTSLDNLAHLCKTHHALKHPSIPDQHRWTARQLPDWTLRWTSPTGRTHVDRPPRRVMFVPSGPEPIAHPPQPGADIDWTTPADAHAPF
ncbi:hypothetical protein QF046_000268 [Microbacterium sp. W4I4]|uniref:HNH endonuclease signature motif containing protein n=1 Tax=Microbacterium sp. W4I4 TaxID=3042295 RepID=UPI002787DDDB|nr:HNH endonuclease signature motif containing protein [Microbacterium sp. W4I4]MDQ0612627.1 hypothetical protein [Microbacterium sp. W4I4]